MAHENAIDLEAGMSEKMWGGEPFWGLGYEWDPDWVLTDRQKELRAMLIELCEKEMRANAKRSDDELLFPRRNLELLGEHGFLALTVPEEYGGLGENHVAYAMTCETIARYGCASTAMCYVMHIGAVNAIMLRPTPELIDKYIRPLNSGKIGTLSYSDPETGSHFWYPISSGAEKVNGGFKVRKKASWTTSAGFADFYVVQTTSPDFSGYDDLSVFVIDGEEAQAQPSLWDALGLRGNQSGPLEVPDVEIPGDQIVGPVGDGAAARGLRVLAAFLVEHGQQDNGPDATLPAREAHLALRPSFFALQLFRVGWTQLLSGTFRVGNLCELDGLTGHDGRDRMFVNQLRMSITPKQYAEVIEPRHDSLEFDAVHQKDRERRFTFADMVEEGVLQVL